MTITPDTWVPLPNPGGQQRRAARTIVSQWLTAQQIPGITKVHNGRRIEMNYDNWQIGGVSTTAQVVVSVGPDSEDRLALAGPTSRGGILYNASMQINFYHMSYSLEDDERNEDDFDRIVDAVRDGLRGQGRDMGRPDVVLVSGEWPKVGKMKFTPNAPMRWAEASSTVQRSGLLSFTTSFYLADQPAITQ